jgi:hypothetical protein
VFVLCDQIVVFVVAARLNSTVSQLAIACTIRSMKSSVSRVINRIIADGPARYLRSQAYHKQARSFFRQTNNIFQVVTFHAGRWNTPGSGDFTVNVSLTFPYFHEIWAGTSFPTNPGRAAHILSWRIGQFLPVQQREWWDVTEQTDTEAVGNEITRILAEQAIPFLDSRSNIESIQTIVGQGGRPADGIILDARICLATVLCYRGYREQARQVLDERRRTSKLEHVVETIEIIQQRLGV